MKKNNKVEMDRVLSSYYHGEEQVIAMVMLKVDTKEADRIANAVAEFPQVRDVFLVTGDTDIICKVKFSDYSQLKSFAIESLAPLEGIKDIRTNMVVTPYKESGNLIEGGDAK